MDLYPEIKPFNQFMLQVSDLHSLYVEESGKPDGVPVLFLHGGPGGGIDSAYRQFFDPDYYRAVLFDQRGCGKSTPFAELQHNTTWDLVADIEKIRERLGIEQWVVFGGSWGSTLALAYAQTHPERVRALVLRGIFLFRQRELDWLYRDGASRLFPAEWQEFKAPVQDVPVDQWVQRYYELLTSPDEATRHRAARAWSVWESSICRLVPNSDVIAGAMNLHHAEAIARIECHYFVNHGWLRHENQLLEDMPKIAHIPGFILHGRYDAVCTVEAAWDLKQHWPKADLKIIDLAGHASLDDNLRPALVAAMEACKHLPA